MAGHHVVHCELCEKIENMVPGAGANMCPPEFWVSIKPQPWVYGRTLTEMSREQFKEAKKQIEQHLRELIGEFMICPTCALKSKNENDGREILFKSRMRKIILPDQGEKSEHENL